MVIRLPVSKDLDLQWVITDWLKSAYVNGKFQASPGSVDVKGLDKVQNMGSIEFDHSSEGKYSIKLQADKGAKVSTHTGLEICEGCSLLMEGTPSTAFWLAVQDSLFEYLLARFGGYFGDIQDGKVVYLKLDRAKRDITEIRISDVELEEVLEWVYHWTETESTFKNCRFEKRRDRMGGTVWFRAEGRTELAGISKVQYREMMTPQGVVTLQGKIVEVRGEAKDGSLRTMLEGLLRRFGGYYSEDCTGECAIFRLVQKTKGQEKKTGKKAKSEESGAGKTTAFGFAE